MLRRDFPDAVGPTTATGVLSMLHLPCCNEAANPQ